MPSDSKRPKPKSIPTGERPTDAAGRMRIAGVICVRVMDAMRYHPIDCSALEREQSAKRQKIFDQLKELCGLEIGLLNIIEMQKR